jgi:hypothetical protein
MEIILCVPFQQLPSHSNPSFKKEAKRSKNLLSDKHDGFKPPFSSIQEVLLGGAGNRTQIETVSSRATITAAFVSMLF